MSYFKSGMDTKMNYNEVSQFLQSASKSGIVLGLSQMSELMKRLGNPQDKLRIIHIAGTNGKGSVGAFLEGILRQKGKRVARYTSPSVFHTLEKYTINSEHISAADFCRCIEKIKSVMDTTLSPTLFEIETAAAFLYFYEQNCDYVLLETGMGGREDATNVVKSPLCSVLTPISMDHMGFLGDTIEKITAEKCGIIKKNCPVVSAAQSDSVKTVIEDFAKESRLIFAQKGLYKSFCNGKQYFDYKDIKDIELSALGKYQIDNAALAIEAAKVVEDFSEAEIRNGLKDVVWQGRFEIISQNPTIIIDGAHNVGAINALVESIKEYFPNKELNFVTGTFADKEYTKTIPLFAPMAKKIFAIAPDNPRALSNTEYAKEIQKYNKNAVAARVDDAIKECISDKNAVTICFGSLSFLADAKNEVIKNQPKSMTRIDMIFNHPLYKSILSETKKLEKDRMYCLHGLEHAMDVARIAYILALEEYVPVRKDIIYASALLHDLGRAEQYKSNLNHTEESVKLAEQILPQCGFSQEEISDIISAIRSHSDEGGVGLTSLLQRADKLSRMCLVCKSIATCKWKKDELNLNILY